MIQISAISTDSGEHRYTLPSSVIFAAMDAFQCGQREAAHELARSFSLDALLAACRIAMVNGRGAAADYLQRASIRR